MQVERTERLFLTLGVLLMLLALVAIAASVFLSNIHLPEPAGRVDARTVVQTEPFDQPGYTEVEPGKFEAVIRASQFLFLGFEFDPDTQESVMRIPAGSEVNFQMVSTDVVHGFMITDTTVNAMVIPGQITEVDFTFEDPGEYLVICHEYCGIGHHLMFAKVIVE